METVLVNVKNYSHYIGHWGKLYPRDLLIGALVLSQATQVLQKQLG
jgi:hypothetical protein